MTEPQKVFTSYLVGWGEYRGWRWSVYSYRREGSDVEYFLQILEEPPDFSVYLSATGWDYEWSNEDGCPSWEIDGIIWAQRGVDRIARGEDPLPGMKLIDEMRNKLA